MMHPSPFSHTIFWGSTFVHPLQNFKIFKKISPKNYFVTCSLIDTLFKTWDQMIQNCSQTRVFLKVLQVKFLYEFKLRELTPSFGYKFIRCKILIQLPESAWKIYPSILVCNTFLKYNKSKDSQMLCN